MLASSAKRQKENLLDKLAMSLTEIKNNKGPKVELVVHHKSTLMNLTFHIQFEQIACGLGENLQTNHVAYHGHQSYRVYITVFDDSLYQMLLRNLRTGHS